MINKMSLYKISLTALLSLFLMLMQIQQVYAAKRIALVIGNADYKNAPLSNPTNDAIDMSEALKEAGFEVDYHTNINRKQMREAIRNFGNKLKQAETGLFYFAGHGIQIKGRNYLIPLAVDVHAADEVEDESIDASAILRKMESAGNAVNIVILDACRNNPFARSFRSLDSGLARMDGPVGSFIAYATAPGSVAADGSGRNGLYTEHLLKALRQPGLSIEQTFKHVRNAVKNNTDGKQIPWESSSLMGEFFFLPTQNKTAPSSLLLSTPPPPPLPLKHLQVLSNVPHAKVMVNNVNRGLTSEQGALNISNLTATEAEVTVQAEGYISQQQKIRLKDGQWEQLYVTLKPVEITKPNQALTIAKNTKHNTYNNCSTTKRVILSSKIIYHSTKGKKIKHNAPNIQTTIINAFTDSGFVFVDVKRMLNKLLRDKKQNRHKLQTLASKNKIQYQLKTTIEVREIPIKILKTNMKTINADITFKLLDIKTHRILATAVRSINKAGLDPKRVLAKQLKQLLPDIRSELLTQACNSPE